MFYDKSFLYRIKLYKFGWIHNSITVIILLLLLLVASSSIQEFQILLQSQMKRILGFCIIIAGMGNLALFLVDLRTKGWLYQSTELSNEIFSRLDIDSDDKFTLGYIISIFVWVSIGLIFYVNFLNGEFWVDSLQLGILFILPFPIALVTALIARVMIEFGLLLIGRFFQHNE